MLCIQDNDDSNYNASYKIQVRRDMSYRWNFETLQCPGVHKFLSKDELTSMFTVIKEFIKQRTPFNCWFMKTIFVYA